MGPVGIGPSNGGDPRLPPPLTLLSLLEEAEDPPTMSGWCARTGWWPPNESPASLIIRRLGGHIPMFGGEPALAM